MEYQKYISQIYEEVFCKTYSESYYVFLCGGAGKEHIRDKVRFELEKRGYQILYPEDLFVDIINNDKRADLLDYENLLADNADIVCVICESPGSFAELGAFVQNEIINKRMVAAINHRYKRDKSFIMLGPIRHLKKINGNCVLEFNEDIECFCDELGKSFNQIKRKWPRIHNNASFDKLSTYIAFIPITLYFFQEIERPILYKEIKEFLRLREILPSKYNDLFNASIKYLIKTRKIVSVVGSDNRLEKFKLASDGLKDTRNVLSKSISGYRNMLHDKIRCGIMKEQFNK